MEKSRLTKLLDVPTTSSGDRGIKTLKSGSSELSRDIVKKFGYNVGVFNTVTLYLAF